MQHCGISAFGLADTICVGDRCSTVADSRPATILVPDHPMAPFVTGQQSRDERLHCGMYWPENARVDSGEGLRRVPVGLAWQMFVASREKAAVWTRSPFPWPVADILAAHIRGTIRECTGWNISDKDDLDRTTHLVVAIPNHLDEYAQSALLASLKKLGNVQLLWRPVAAAMSWLSRLDPAACPDGRNMFVAYLGPDALEVTTFEVRKLDNLLLPVRSRPALSFPLSGLDMAFAFAKSLSPVCAADKGALWQAALRFSDLWERLRGQDTPGCPEPWSTKDGWQYWEMDMHKNPLRVPAAPDPWLLDLADRKAPARTVAGIANWEQRMAEFLGKATGNIVGGVFCGPMAGLLGNMSVFGTFLSARPQLGKIWLARKDCIAEGCALYSERLAAGLPTYLDTLPKLEIYCQENFQGSWFDLVPAAHVAGGQLYTNIIDDRFKLDKNSPILRMFLKKEGEPGESDQDLLRKAKVDFEEVPESDVQISVHVEMRPASGLAKVTLIPRETNFRNGRKVQFDFGKMLPCTEEELPNPWLPFPEELHIEVLPGGINWQRSREVYNILTWQPQDIQIESRRNALWNNLKWINAKYRDSQDFSYVAKIDERGDTGDPANNKIVVQVAEKLADIWEDFRNTSDARKFLTHATYLWRATPDSVVEAIFSAIQEKARFGWSSLSSFPFVMEAAGRCFSDKEHCRALFNLCRIENSSHMNYISGATRLLNYYGPAKNALTDELGYFFVKQALAIVEKEINAHNIKKKFYGGILLFLMALKQRANNMDFMNPNKDTEARRYFDKMTELIDRAQRISPDRRSKDLLEKIRDFMNYKGVAGVITIISANAET